MRGLVALVSAATLLTVLLRVWICPALQSPDTGHLKTATGTIVAVLVCVAALAVLGYLVGGERRDVAGAPARGVALTAALGGVVLAGAEGLALARDATGWLERGQHLLGVLSGAALVLLGLRILTEGATRRGISQWSMLIPVAWMWLRLVNYEMSYASMVRVQDGFFDFMMLIAQLLFLFKWARYTAGVGRVGTGALLFYALTAALFSLSAPLVKGCMYLLEDGQALAAYQQVGLAEVAIGALALAVAVTQLYGAAAPSASADAGAAPSAPDAAGESTE